MSETQHQLDAVTYGPEFELKEEKPKQNNYVRIITQQQEIVNEMFYLRHEWEDNKRDLFDLNELVGRLARKIEE